MEYLYVFNYEICSIQEITLSDEEEEKYSENAEAILRSRGINPDSVSYMFSDCELDIEKL